MMKKLTHSIKIGFIRRSALPSKPNEHQSSDKNDKIDTQQEPHHMDSHEQVDIYLQLGFYVK